MGHGMPRLGPLMSALLLDGCRAMCSDEGDCELDWFKGQGRWVLEDLHVVGWNTYCKKVDTGQPVMHGHALDARDSP